MPKTTDGLPASPLFIAVQALFQNTNAPDRTADLPGRQDLDAEAAKLCRRAADELDSRL